MTSKHTSGNGERALMFPADFTLKIIGKSDNNFENDAIAIIHKYFPNIDKGSIQVRSSKESNYIALSVTVRAESQEQLDKVYTELTNCPDIIFVL